jgi:hypothetical protein
MAMCAFRGGGGSEKRVLRGGLQGVGEVAHRKVNNEL